MLRDDGSETSVDEPGELVARGDNIMRGYWNDEPESALVLTDRGYLTGDLARRDADGFLWIVGRKKDMIKAGAHRIAAQEIEAAILSSSLVHEAAVIGEPDELLGEAICAFVVFRGQPDIDALVVHLKTVLPPYKRPSRIVPIADLPKNESGKIIKNSLRQT